ncbi:amidohydrolase [Flavihumibacter fluvii]|uniref:amidohydrolase n=1 Tax=Flavihumibacter fluvii TaxID=2838157 RepID=UPI001BDE5328|nr:amidohydrolase family protein [Flavihumibacter fluvii]ULQ54305.1 amidohydrolase family protein [Flavihumibacter fluvii]
MTKVFFHYFITVCCLSLIGRENLSGQSADLILTNGKIFTSDTSKLFVQAIAIKGNKILATGSDATIEKLASSKTKQIDLKGKTVVPGFNDQHDHAAFQQSPAPLRYETTDDRDLNWDGLPKAAVLDSIARLLQKAKPGEWIAGMIGNRIFHDTSLRHSLDSMAPNNPVALQVWWGHGIVVNQKCLEAAGLGDDLKDPVGGWYVRNGEGKIVSAHENAQIAFWHAIAKAYPGAVKKMMEDFGKEQLKGGITSTLFFGSSFSYTTITAILKEASIPQRLRIVAWLNATHEGRQLSEWPLTEVHPTSMSTISGVKYMINHFGPLNFTVDTLKRILKEALITKRQLMMHISGDSAFGVLLKLIKESGTAEQWRPLRVRVEHNMIGYPDSEQRKLLRDYGILIMHTPKYNMGSPIRSLLRDDILVGVAPDGTINPFWDIMVITTQQTKPEENITREQAVITYTKTNAFAEFREKEKGTLTKGMLADLVVLSQDIFSIPADRLPATESVLTMIDGKIVYERTW